MRRLTRRLLIGGGTVAVLGGAAAGGSLAFCAARAAPQARIDAARFLYAALEFAPADIGRAVLARAGAPALWAAFEARADLQELARWDCPGTRAARLGLLFRADFARGEHVLIDRWLVAASEALIAGLGAAVAQS